MNNPQDPSAASQPLPDPAATPSSRVQILPLSGRLGVQAEHDLAVTLGNAVDCCPGSLLLDMAGVEFLSSSGLRALLLAYKKADSAGKKIAMAQVRPAVYKIFKLTASEALFHIYETNADALAWLARG
jgi:anti-anti-sigma factor